MEEMDTEVISELLSPKKVVSEIEDENTEKLISSPCSDVPIPNSFKATETDMEKGKDAVESESSEDEDKIDNPSVSISESKDKVFHLESDNSEGEEATVSKYQRLILSSDDEDSDANNKNSKQSQSASAKRKKRLIGSDSEDDDMNDKNSDNEKHVSDAENIGKPLSDDDEEDLPDIHPLPKHSSQQNHGIFLDPNTYGDDSDEEPLVLNNDSPSDSDAEEQRRQNTFSAKKGKKKLEKKVPKRKASEKSREKTLQELTSQTQKMVRDSRVSLPYHKPKQLTLDEFLKKRNKAKAPLLSSLIENESLGSMRNTVSLEEDVLPILAQVEKDKENDLKAMMMNVSVVLQAEDKVDSSMNEKEDEGSLSDGMEISKPIVESLEESTKITEMTAENETKEAIENITDSTSETLVTSDATTNIAETGMNPASPNLTKNVNEESIPLPNNIESSSEIEIVPKIPDAPLKEILIVEEEKEVDEQKEDDSNVKEKEMTSTTSFEIEEAELNAFLKAKDPKPKKQTLAERLRNMPGFDKIANLKPKVGGGDTAKSFITFGGQPKGKAKDEKGIQLLMDRFVRHTFANKHQSPTKPEHVKLHVTKTEQDSEGLLHSTVDEIDYVESMPTDEEQDIFKDNNPYGYSTKEMVPGAKLFRLRNTLKEQISLKKAKEYEERVKEHAMYTEELDLEDKMSEDGLPSDEELLDEDDVELSESDQDEEEEANDDNDDELEEAAEDIDEDCLKTDEKLDENSEGSLANEDKENKIPIMISQTKRRAKPLCIDSDEEEEEEQENPSTTTTLSKILQEEESLPVPIKMLISAENAEPVEELLELCSGKFPSQAPATPFETQDCFGFDVDEDESDGIVQPEPKKLQPKRLFTELEDEPSPQPKGFVDDEAEISGSGSEDEDEDKSIIESKGLLKPKRLFGDNVEDSVDSFINDVEELSGDKSKIIQAVKPKPKYKRLLSKGGEQLEKIHSKGADGILSATESEGESADEEEEEIDEDEEIIVPVVKPKGLFGANGMLRKKFLEEEAELSGSDDESGDEDERGLNHYEKDDADDEEFDEEKLRHQVERAHLKLAMDDDYRRLNVIKEKFLTDGEFGDVQKRERKFRWSNIGDDFGDDGARMGDSDDEEDDDEEEEIKKKLADVERRKWITEHPELFEASEEESQKMLFENSRFLKLGKSTMKKIECFVDNSSSFSMNDTSCSVPDISFKALVKSQIKTNAKAVLASSSFEEIKDDFDDQIRFAKATSQPLFASPDEPISRMKKGSFLSRGSPSLSRLAELTKVNDSTNNVKSNSRNFVFSVVTPPDQESKLKGPKRPAQNQGKIQPKKMARVDRSFSNLDSSSKDASIFKWM